MFLALTGIRPANALTVAQIRLIATKNNVSGVFVFGDSSVDPGNNNGLKTDAKSNFPPYGMDFFSGHPTGRFSNGRLATDYIGKVQWVTTVIEHHMAWSGIDLKMAKLLSFKIYVFRCLGPLRLYMRASMDGTEGRYRRT
nr:GDSL esterase/lipase At5g45950-like [Tanacetum cinerariifolium]